ncbi:Acyl-CoA synthetase (AMP-forming)/AMP-acid ligase II [Thermomonospora echinospora]|uniref:Acyl-CoA synthetase (AMP-forming)/AMP-acid ligase II n=1 Tax=Thermomonospora echinospora TaxID=1992 RepID=A0A1H6DIV7_9ACTN|nr:AMP-binding protein [Thermomonospora echinospora]SEG85119.1 Acyl-CoA synthetase (AMP-forming)/AMP-acid ligase II [Thermomonospora echinospora]
MERSLTLRTIPAELVQRYEAEGWWTRDTLGDLLARGLQAAPGTRFRVHSAVRPWDGTFGDVERVARRLAGGLRGRGVGPGDVVAFQLPNWMEAAAVFWASAFLGAAVVPIVHFYGRKEVGYILETIKPRVFVSAERFGRMEHQPDLCADVPVVGVVGRDFEDLLADDPMPGVLAADPADPALIAFTSGTTRDPKGVVHSHRTLGYETRQLAGLYPPDRGRQLTAAPVGHFIGMVNAFLIPVLDGTPVNLADVWDPARVLALMEDDGLTVGGGATYYMTSLLDHPDFTPGHLAHMKYAGLGGAAVPAAVTTRLAELGITVFRSYGSTEHPSITGSRHTAPEAKRLFTDGDALPGVEIRLGEDGEIFSRGPDLCIGYTDPALTEAAFDADGWYRTGDIGVLDADGYLTITDRKSDVIIRGGENISAPEVEDLLLAMPAIAEAAVVAAPDPRLGEHAAAVVRLRPGHDVPTLDQLRAHLERAGLARQKWPEELHVVADFPRTASGKVQKFLLRRDIAAHNR